MNFKIEFEREEGGRWIAEIPDLPGVLAYGATKDEAEARVLNLTASSAEGGSMQVERLEIPAIELEWSDWVPWSKLKVDPRSGLGVIVPNGIPGVYEARLVGMEERLTIGKAADLRMRIKQGLVKGKAKHSSGNKIRANEGTSRIEVRWAETDRPAAAEEELHKRYEKSFARLPKYTEHT